MDCWNERRTCRSASLRTLHLQIPAEGNPCLLFSPIQQDRQVSGPGPDQGLGNCSLFESHHLASPHTFQRAHRSGGPADYNFVNLAARAQAKMRAHIA